MTITRDTAAKIAYAHSEINEARELLTLLSEAKRDRKEPDFRDAFGRQRGLQLGIPSGSGHRLLDVSPDLAVYVIEAHIGKMQQRIAELCAIARMELDGVKTERAS